MTKKEREQLRTALDHLEHNPIEWEDAMALLYPMAGFEYRDLRVKREGEGVIVLGGVVIPNKE
jgi:hypothetical protein